nr:hypothetical protein [Tanacetum cinerariifolium]
MNAKLQRRRLLGDAKDADCQRRGSIHCAHPLYACLDGDHTITSSNTSSKREVGGSFIIPTQLEPGTFTSILMFPAFKTVSNKAVGRIWLYHSSRISSLSKTYLIHKYSFIKLSMFSLSERLKADNAIRVNHISSISVDTIPIYSLLLLLSYLRTSTLPSGYPWEEVVHQKLQKTLTHVLELSSCVYLDDRAWGS